MARSHGNEFTLQAPQYWDEDQPLDLRHYWNVIDRKKWAILGLALAVTLLAALTAFAMTPVYRASATVLIESREANVVSIDEVYGLDTQAQQYYATQFEILDSRPLAEDVVAKLDLSSDPEFAADKRGKGFTLNWRAWLPFARPVLSTTTQTDPLQGVIANYVRHLAIEPVRNTQLVRVNFESATPALAARAANAHAQAYIDSLRNDRVAVTGSAGTWLAERLGELEQTLRESEQRLQAFREQEQVIDAEGLQSLPVREVNDLTSRLVDVRRKLSQAEIAYRQVANLEDTSLADRQGIPAILEDQVVRSFQQAEAAARQKVAELEKRYGPKHPKMIAAQSELAEATRNLAAQHNSVATAIRNEYEAAKAEEAALVRALATARQQYQTSGRKESELNELQREVDTNRKLYELFYNRIGETSATGDLQSAPARIIAPAVVPATPARPNKTRIVGLAFVLTLIAGIMLAFLLESLNNSVRSAADVEEKLRLPLLGMVPRLKIKRNQRGALGSVFSNKIEPGFNEAIRSVRTSISLDNLEHPHKVIVIASSIGGEGKSTVALNLAHAFAKSERVLLLEADMRRPSIGRALKLPRATRPGLSELLAEQATLAECLFRGGKGQMDVLLSGSIPADPSQLLSSRRLVNALLVLRRRYDRIIIDSPPILPVSDALVLSAHADTVIFVAKSDATSIRQINQALDLLLRVNARVTGVVVNQLDVRKAAKYSDYGYGGYYESYESLAEAS
ncbi:MAG: polysaccharide biosynthesis tyrosine autokinase [Gammaproteobacteria bacterium]|nr:polysaccharide biosynthesis tyrosine autokinase [Gammaproteobacteria bacterium]MDH3415330.1 polysaccharide biosynthesis tyrosine autokinase [Gammaproteobacteria bacterium]